MINKKEFTLYMNIYYRDIKEKEYDDVGFIWLVECMMDLF